MTNQYNQKISNINAASIIQSQPESALNEELWYIVSRNKKRARQKNTQLISQKWKREDGESLPQISDRYRGIKIRTSRPESS